jgi:ATP-dependent helicase/nuclease subunit A
MSFVPVDEGERRRAREDHRTSLVLEAGAGTGKTTLLVDRIEALVRSGDATLDEIAAVTFTENAATSMKLRLREALERARLLVGSGVEGERIGRALDTLERAQISTIHALCAAILQERPLECGVTPGFRTADEAEADILFAQAWEEWLSEQLSGNEETVVLEALENDIPLESPAPFQRNERQSLRGLARALIEGRDLAPLDPAPDPDPRAWLAELREQADSSRALLREVKPGETLGSRLAIFADYADRASSLEGAALRAHLLGIAPISEKGFKAHWSSPEAHQRAQAIARWTGETPRSWAVAAEAARYGRIVRALAGVGRLYERKKTQAGVLDFMDLLVKTREALADPNRPSVRAAVKRRFSHLLVDEFQDTDPIQVEIVRLIAGGRRGALVVVGDPKQSIYRFRRAEVSLFSDLSREAASRPGFGVLHLTQNFRSRPGILAFANRVFSRLIQASEASGQPAYEELRPRPDLDDETSVVALRFGSFSDTGADALRIEARTLARYLSGVGEGSHEVRDPASGELRPSRAGDVMILSRRLTQIHHLEQALEEAQVRFTVEGGKSFFDRAEVREAVAVLRAIDDPWDRISRVAALRSSFLGVNDREIVGYVLAGGSLSAAAVDAEKPGAEALGPAFALLAGLHKKRTEVSVPYLLEALYDETRVLPAFLGARKGEAQVANLEKVVTLARQASGLGILTLRGFVSFLEERIAAAREEPDLPPTRPGDPETVRILSIHKAKGLEAPIVALYDSEDPGGGLSPDAIPLWKENRVAIGFRKNCQPQGWDQLVTEEKKKQAAENIRLLYVATTRARDLLILPHPTGGRGGFWSPLVAPPLEGVHVEEVVFEEDPQEAREDLRALAVAKGGDPTAEEWEERRAGEIADGAYRPFVPVPASRVAARSAPPPVLTLPRAGGRNFGTLVHRILELIDLGRGEDAPTLASALAPALGQGEEQAEAAARIVQRTLELPLLERARKAPRVFRELPIVFADEGDLVEGIVDLAFEEDGGLVVVDYKTESVAKEQVLAQAAHHAPQLQIYGRGLSQATGLPVRERLLVFVSPGETVAV